MYQHPLADPYRVTLEGVPVNPTGTPPHDQPGLPVRTVGQDVWAAAFSAVGASVLDPQFTAPRVGAGVTFNQAAGALNVLAGTTANAEFLTRSLRAFRGSMRLRFSSILSARIANNNFAILLADLVLDSANYTIVNSTTVDVAVPGHGFDAKNVGQFLLLGGITGAAGVPGRYAIASIPGPDVIRFTVAGWPASGTGTLTLFGRNYVRNLFNGTTPTNVAVDAQGGGWATGDTTATINTTASPGVVIANELTGRDLFFSDALRATSQVPNFATRASRYENLPDQTTDLYVFIWSFNGTGVPAGNTTLTLGHVALESFANDPVYIQGFRAQGNVNPLFAILGASAANIGAIALQAGQTLGTVTTLTGGSAAEDAATTANPHIMGGVVRDNTAPVTLIAGDAARLTMTRGAAAVFKPYAVAEAGWNASVLLTTTTATALQIAGGASLKRQITALQAYNGGAAVVDLIILDGATERWRLPLAVGVVTPIVFPTELLATAATALNANLGAVNTGVRVNAQGYTSA